jgi:hypothetical protein
MALACMTGHQPSSDMHPACVSCMPWQNVGKRGCGCAGTAVGSISVGRLVMTLQILPTCDSQTVSSARFVGRVCLHMVSCCSCCDIHMMRQLQPGLLCRPPYIRHCMCFSHAQAVIAVWQWSSCCGAAAHLRHFWHIPFWPTSGNSRCADSQLSILGLSRRLRLFFAAVAAS